MIAENAYIEITNICNLNCRSCYNRSGLNCERRELSFDQIKEICNRLISQFGCKSIGISGGEPTLHSEFDKIIDYLASLDCEVLVVTNGTTDCRRLCEVYNSSNIFIQVSLDGSCEEINAKTRGEGSFDAAMEFVSRLHRQNERPHLKMVVSQNNIEDIENFYLLALKNNCIPNYSFVSPLGNATDKWDNLTLTAKQKLFVLREVDRLNKLHSVEAKLPLCTSSCPLANPESRLSVLIKPDGGIYPCQMLYDEGFCMGNILSGGYNEICAAHKRISDIAKRRMSADFGCDRCVVRPLCRRGCMAFAVMQSGNPLGNDGDCMFRKLQLLGFDAVNAGIIKLK